MEHNQKPLTMERLRQMDGQPVWIEDEERFGLVSVTDVGTWKGVPFVRFCESGAGFEYNVENRGLKLYACKPIDFDKWEPCSVCGHRGCWSCRYRGTYAELEPCRDCGNSGKQFDRYKPLPFCPQCGRPLRPRSRRQLEKRIMEG